MVRVTSLSHYNDLYIFIYLLNLLLFLTCLYGCCIGSPQRCRFAASAGGAGEEEAQTQASRSVAQFFLHGI